MPRADFAYITFDAELNAGNTNVTKSFQVDGPPLPGDSYLLALTRDVSSANHRIAINGQDLPVQDLRETDSGWATQFDRIPSGFLKNGPNRITVTRVGNDDFRMNTVVVHWREA